MLFGNNREAKARSVFGSSTEPIALERPDSGLPKQELLVKDLATKSVTLYPSRAHIVREINDVTLKPGQNEVHIYGITPTADEHSVQIDGKGAATITDITVELLPNREIFQDVYPDPEETESDEEDAASEDDEEPESIKALSEEIEKLQAEIKEANEVQNSAARRLETLDGYSRTLRAEHNNAEDVSKLLEVYDEQRASIFTAHQKAAETIRKRETQISKKEKEKTKLEAPHKKKQFKEYQKKLKLRDQKNRRKLELRKQADRIKEERLKFWPKKVYRIIVSLETASTMDTPASSRRGSMDSVTLSRGYTPDVKDTDAPSSNANEETTVSLTLSYVTRDASWSPRYDLNISSVQKSATIAYRAEFVNGTSETWKDAQLILSTSQTSYQGLDDKVPFMHGWHVKLGKFHDQGLLSPEEINKPRVTTAAAPVTNRNELFGSSNTVFTYGNQAQQQQQALVLRQKQVQQQQQAQQQQQVNALSQHGANWQPQQAQSGGLFGNKPQAPSSGFGSNSKAAIMTSGGGLFGSASNATNAFGARASRRTEDEAVIEAVEDSEESYKPPKDQPLDDVMARNIATVMERGERLDALAKPSVEFEEGEWDDHGLTSTYEVPGARTLTPSSLTRRHKIATLTASNIHLSHVAVPKLRTSAFLRAKLRNPSSSVTLLKGTAGVTLDGSFLGNMTLNRVSPGQIFDLPLGVDPAVHVNYPKPSVHRSTQGIFTKESAQLFSRSVWLTNTKSQPVELLVLDQIPVSEDERLKIDIVQPRGLSKEGDLVRAGSAAKEGTSGTSSASASQSASWGKATARLEKDGKVAWTVMLEKKQACLLKLEYEAKMPATEKIMPA